MPGMLGAVGAIGGGVAFVGIPGSQALTIPAAGVELLTDIPQVASGVAQGIRRLGEKLPQPIKDIGGRIFGRELPKRFGN